MILFTHSGLLGLDTIYEVRLCFVVVLADVDDTSVHCNTENKQKGAHGCSFGNTLYLSQYHDVYGKKEKVYPIANPVGW